jgi:hypothetical protein
MAVSHFVGTNYTRLVVLIRGASGTKEPKKLYSNKCIYCIGIRANITVSLVNSKASPFEFILMIIKENKHLALV